MRSAVIVLLLLTAVSAWAETRLPDDINRRITVGGGICVYGDALGGSLLLGFTQSLDGWFRWANPSFNTGLTPLEIGFLADADLVPISFFLYAVNLTVSAGWRFELGPVAATPYLAAGLPFTVVGTGRESKLFTGFTAKTGLRIAFVATSDLDVGVTAEYRANLTGNSDLPYLGSIGVNAYIGMRL